MTEVWCFACYGAGYIKINNINIVCPTCHGQGTLRKGEQEMSEEEVVRATVTFDGPLNDLQQKINQYETTIKEQAERLDKRLGDISKLQVAVHNFFKDQFDGGDDEITVHRDEANELLGEIGADLLQQEFDLARVPARDTVRMVERLDVREAPLKRCQLLLELIPDKGRRALVLIQYVRERVELVV